MNYEGPEIWSCNTRGRHKGVLVRTSSNQNKHKTRKIEVMTSEEELAEVLRRSSSWKMVLRGKTDVLALSAQANHRMSSQKAIEASTLSCS